METTWLPADKARLMAIYSRIMCCIETVEGLPDCRIAGMVDAAIQRLEGADSVAVKRWQYEMKTDP